MNNIAPHSFKGSANPNWKGGLVYKTCSVCSAGYTVKRVHAASKFCSLQCVGISQRGRKLKASTKVTLQCEVCAKEFQMFRAHAHRHRCCSRSCSYKLRSKITKGQHNPNWCGGLSRMPYPYNFRDISRSIIERDGFKCQNPTCRGTTLRMTTHHINYDKLDCRNINLIALCSSCNSRANFGRVRWQRFYEKLMAERHAVDPEN